jgi:hypothetical protein
MTIGIKLIVMLDTFRQILAENHRLLAESQVLLNRIRRDLEHFRRENIKARDWLDVAKRPTNSPIEGADNSSHSSEKDVSVK